MVTRAKAGIFKPLERMNCHVTTTSPLPRSHIHALRDPHWKEAMLDEYNALISNGTWALVPRPANVNVRSLYGLKQAPRAWFQRFASYATRVGFQHTSSSAFLQRIITSLHSEFAMTDLGSLNYFLGISAQRSATGLFLSQSKFAEEILERAHMQNSKHVRTPVDIRVQSWFGCFMISSTTQLTAYTDARIWLGALLLVVNIRVFANVVAENCLDP
ncbi:ribonuclease H-like domain-containing protein [Tanacetum coccineum]